MMEEFGSLNPSAAADLLNVTGVSPSLFSTVVEDYGEFAALLNHGTVCDNSLQEQSRERIDFDGEFIYSDSEFHDRVCYSLQSSSEVNSIVQDKDLFVMHTFLQEENFGPQLVESSVESSNFFVSLSNKKSKSSIEFADDGMYCQFQNADPARISVVSSTKNLDLPAMNYEQHGHDGYCWISSDSNEQDDQSVSLSSPRGRSRNSSQENLSGLGLPGEKRLHSDSFGGSNSSTDNQMAFKLTKERNPKQKKPRSENPEKITSNINFSDPNSPVILDPDTEAIARMKEMIYREAALRPISIGVIEKPKRNNVRISTDPQTVAARQRRERIGDRFRILQRLVPGGTKMDIASMLDEVANYLRYLKSQVSALQSLETTKNTDKGGLSTLSITPVKDHAN